MPDPPPPPPAARTRDNYHYKDPTTGRKVRAQPPERIVPIFVARDAAEASGGADVFFRDEGGDPAGGEEPPLSPPRRNLGRNPRVMELFRQGRWGPGREAGGDGGAGLAGEAIPAGGGALLPGEAGSTVSVELVDAPLEAEQASAERKGERKKRKRKKKKKKRREEEDTQPSDNTDTGRKRKQAPGLETDVPRPSAADDSGHKRLKQPEGKARQSASAESGQQKNRVVRAPQGPPDDAQPEVAPPDVPPQKGIGPRWVAKRPDHLKVPEHLQEENQRAGWYNTRRSEVYNYRLHRLYPGIPWRLASRIDEIKFNTGIEVYDGAGKVVRTKFPKQTALARKEVKELQKYLGDVETENLVRILELRYGVKPVYHVGDDSKTAYLVTEKRERRKIKEFVAQTPHHEACFTITPAVPGYSFVPKGNSYVTRLARKLTLEASKTIYVVCKGYKKTLGIQVPKEIHDTALEHDRLTKSDRDHTANLRQQRLERQAEYCLRGMFTAIPDEDVEKIVKRAFEKYSGRVGRTGKLPLPEKLRLATLAHIRHAYSRYDECLNELARTTKMSKQQRQRVGRKEAQRHICEKWRAWGPPDNRVDVAMLDPKDEARFIELGKQKVLAEKRKNGEAADDEDEEVMELDATSEEEEDEDDYDETETEDDDDWEKMGDEDFVIDISSDEDHAPDRPDPRAGSHAPPDPDPRPRRRSARLASTYRDPTPPAAAAPSRQPTPTTPPPHHPSPDLAVGTGAALCLRGLFPRIPRTAIAPIVRLTFEHIPSADTSLPERLRLAAIQHIRSTHTSFLALTQQLAAVPGMSEAQKLKNARRRTNAATLEIYRSWDPPTPDLGCPVAKNRPEMYFIERAKRAAESKGAQETGMQGPAPRPAWWSPSPSPSRGAEARMGEGSASPDAVKREDAADAESLWGAGVVKEEADDAAAGVVDREVKEEAGRTPEREMVVVSSSSPVGGVTPATVRSRRDGRRVQVIDISD